jgi:hypothetical protein
VANQPSPQSATAADCATCARIHRERRRRMRDPPRQKAEGRSPSLPSPNAGLKPGATRHPSPGRDARPPSPLGEGDEPQYARKLVARTSDFEVRGSSSRTSQVRRTQMRRTALPIPAYIAKGRDVCATHIVQNQNTGILRQAQNDGTPPVAIQHAILSPFALPLANGPDPAGREKGLRVNSAKSLP